MSSLWWFVIAWAIAAAAITNSLLLWWTLRARRHDWFRASASLTDGPPVTVIRPMRGEDRDAVENHRSLIEQQYGRLRVVFATGVEGDAAVVAARAACRDAAARVTVLAVDPGENGLSDKGRKMIAAWATTPDPFIAFSDSDLNLRRDALARCMQQFDTDDVGAVFAHCIVVADGILGRLSTLTIAADGYAFLLGTARSNCALFLEGGFMVLRRGAVDAAGGIAQVGNAIGDDTRLGRALRQAGFRLRLADFTLIHRTSRERPSAWAARYRRWLMCHRAEATSGFYAELFLNPTAVPMMLALVAPTAYRSAVLDVLVVGAACRVAIAACMDSLLLERHGIRLGWWVVLRPLADLVHFVFCLSVLVAPWVRWRGIKYWVSPNGNIVASSEEPSAPAMQANPAVDA
jgi:ceramide glucosyltransferase